VRVLGQHLLQTGFLLRADACGEAEFGGATHNSERRAQFVRGVGHEVALAAQRRLDRL